LIELQYGKQIRITKLGHITKELIQAYDLFTATMNQIGFGSAIEEVSLWICLDTNPFNPRSTSCHSAHELFTDGPQYPIVSLFPIM
jgi:hypothetical protein